MPRFVPGSAPPRPQRRPAALCGVPRPVAALALSAMLLAALAACDTRSSKSSPTLTAVTISPADATLEAGQTQQFAAKGTYSDGSNVDLSGLVTWSSSDAAVAIIDGSGLVTGVAGGAVAVTAREIATGFSDTVVVTVTETVETLSVFPDVLTLEVDGTSQLAATLTQGDGSSENVTGQVGWSSDDTEIATVSSTGLVTGEGAGVAQIAATLGALTVELSVTVHAPAATPVSSSNVFVLPQPEIVTSGAFLTVNIPDPAVSIGIIVWGSNTNYKVADHGIWLTLGGSPVYMTDPNGDQVPMAFNMIENSIGVEVPTGDNLVNAEAASPFFPNDGSTPTLPAGDYTFPIAAFDAGGFGLEADTLTPIVLYKTSAPEGQTMNVNLFVVEGVVAGATSAAEAEADPEVAGAIEVLRNVYQDQVGLNLNVTVEFVAVSSFAILDSLAEQDMLVSTFPPGAPSTALNLFIISEIAYLDEGVIGYSLGVPGPFNLDGTVVSGTLAEYQGDGVGAILGFTLAHEFGHFLGLWHPSQTNLSQTGIIGHDPISDTPACTTADVQLAGGIDNCPDRTNLMFPIVDDAVDPPITDLQATVIRLNPAVAVPLP